MDPIPMLLARHASLYRTHPSRVYSRYLYVVIRFPPSIVVALILDSGILKMRAYELADVAVVSSNSLMISPTFSSTPYFSLTPVAVILLVYFFSFRARFRFFDVEVL